MNVESSEAILPESEKDDNYGKQLEESTSVKKRGNSQSKRRGSNDKLTSTTVTEGDDNGGDDTSRKLGFWDIVIFQTVFDTSGAIVTFPAVIGQLGYILGPILLILWCLLAFSMNSFLIDVILDAKKIGCTYNNLGEVGYAIGGKVGQIALRTVQLVNLIFFLPVVLSLQASSWQYIANSPWDCVGHWEVIVSGVLLVLLMMIRSWHDASWLAYVSLIKTVLKAFVFLPWSYVYYQDEIQSSTYYLGETVAFGAPNGNNAWNQIVGALGLICYAYTPVFILAGTMAETKDPNCYKKALWVSTVIQIILYLVPGIMGAVMWGWSIEVPVTLELPREWLGILLNLFVAIAALVDYIVASQVTVPATKAWIQEIICVRRDGTGGGSVLSSQLLSHFFSLLLGVAISLVLVLIVPNFESLVGILVGFTIIGANTYIIGLSWLFGCGNRIDTKAFTKFLLFIAIAIGVPLSASVIAGSIYDTLNTWEVSNSVYCNN